MTNCKALVKALAWALTLRVAAGQADFSTIDQCGVVADQISSFATAFADQCHLKLPPPAPSAEASTPAPAPTERPTPEQAPQSTVTEASTTETTSPTETTSTGSTTSSTSSAAATDPAKSDDDEDEDDDDSDDDDAAGQDKQEEDKSSDSGPSGLSVAARAGIGASIGVVGLSIILIGVIFLFRRRAKKASASPSRTYNISGPMPGSGRDYADSRSDFSKENHTTSELEMTSRRYEDMLPRAQPSSMI
ncbi:unnamed protein product [Parascedosporium putredinis]|uniref:Mid2 domain-containing protein n=1 Tax=Parascedosporium putredinis TaxID=1442378 RepID=A0A9P1H1L6_9PEZI|nr:unnamed protein product [Parascedosporium putredinis]CAI7995271.1 unnamed protein product [Parascedosporium putredinis]